MIIEEKPEMTSSVQPQLLAAVPVVGRAVVLRLRTGSDAVSIERARRGAGTSSGNRRGSLVEWLNQLSAGL